VERLAISYMQDENYVHAHKLLDLRIANAYNPASAWYHKGIIHWDEGKLSNAYSALTTGLRYKDRRLDIQVARGHILAEWNHPEEAIADLNEALESPQLRLSVAVRVRSARAYAFFQRQKSPQHRPGGWREMVDLAITELEHAEADMAVSPWPYYFRGLCSKLHHDMLCASTREPKDDVSRAIINSRDNMHSDFGLAVKHGFPYLNRHTIRTMKDALTSSEANKLKLLQLQNKNGTID
jgi:tetratricopeptide (TPR) repeat protein